MRLDVENVTAGYEGTPIVRGVDCTVDDGEIVGIMGKNGVGKTTLLKTIMGLLNPDKGTVRVDGKVVIKRHQTEAETVGDAGIMDRLSESVRSIPDRLTDDEAISADERAALGIGYVPQGRDVFPGLTVEQNLLMGETVGGDDQTLYDTVYDLFPILEERADQDAGTLSGGQQQMLAIGRALVGGPDLLLVDEPSEGVQPSIVQSITDDLARINEELGTTVLFVEQNLSVVQQLADRCYAMDRGAIVDELDGTELENRENLEAHLAV